MRKAFQGKTCWALIQGHQLPPERIGYQQYKDISSVEQRIRIVHALNSYMVSFLIPPRSLYAHTYTHSLTHSHTHLPMTVHYSTFATRGSMPPALATRSATSRTRLAPHVAYTRQQAFASCGKDTPPLLCPAQPLFSIPHTPDACSDAACTAQPRELAAVCADKASTHGESSSGAGGDCVPCGALAVRANAGPCGG